MLYPIELLGRMRRQHLNEARLVCHARVAVKPQVLIRPSGVETHK